MITENDLKLSRGAVAAITDEVRDYGSVSQETGGFLLAPVGDHTVSKVALAGRTGIVRRHNFFEISALAIDRLFTFADDSELWSPAQVHSHEEGRRLSLTDRKHGFRVEGFTSIVVPHFHAPSSEIGDWGWWTFVAGQWIPTRPLAPCHGSVQILRFDEDGVRDA